MSTAPEGDRTIGGSRSGSGIWGKVAVVTGSSKGIGKAVARKLGEGGASVVINARSADEIKSAEEELRGLGCEVSGIALNVAHDGGAEELVAHAAERYGPVGLLVNMVAINPPWHPCSRSSRAHSPRRWW